MKKKSNLKVAKKIYWSILVLAILVSTGAGILWEVAPIVSNRSQLILASKILEVTESAKEFACFDSTGIEQKTAQGYPIDSVEIAKEEGANCVDQRRLQTLIAKIEKKLMDAIKIVVVINLGIAGVFLLIGFILRRWLLWLAK